MSSVIQSTDCFNCDRKLCRFLNRDNPRNRPHKHALKRGERLETCTTGCLKFWVLVRGTAAVCVSLPDGRRQISSIETAGSTLCGPMAAEEDATWLEALEPCEVCELDFSDRANELRQDNAFLSAMFGVIHNRLTEASRHLVTLGRLDSTERVVLFLATMARGNGQSGTTHLALSREDIADYLGLNAETVSRIFSRLKKSGLFRFTSPTDFVVPDFQAVARRLPVPIPDPGADTASQSTDKEYAG